MTTAIRLCLAVASVCGLSCGAAVAQSLTGNVGSAGVSAGERAAEFRVGIEDGNNAASRLHYDHALNDWYQVRLIGAFRRRDGDDWDYTGVTVENWFQWSQEQSDNTGFNGGFRLAYTFADGGGQDEIAARLTLTDKFGEGWEWRGNVIASLEAGDGSEGGAELESRLQLTRALRSETAAKWRAGVELFSEYGTTRDVADLDEQAHQLGPVIKASWKNGVYIQSAIRFGITDAADDSMAKLFVGREF